MNHLTRTREAPFLEEEGLPISFFSRQPPSLRPQRRGAACQEHGGER